MKTWNAPVNGGKVALMLFYNNFDDEGRIKVEEFARLGKQLGVTTLNDAAADVPPVENFARYLRMGYDLVVFSGGKGLRGPQSSGLLLGRKELIEAAALNNNPNTDTVGRTNKVGKEEIVGMWAALRRFLKQDHAAVWRDWEKRVQTIADLVGAVKGVKAEPFVPPIANHSPHLRITWGADVGLTPAEVAKRLREGSPHIEVRPIIGEALELSVWMLEPGEERLVGERIRDAAQTRLVRTNREKPSSADTGPKRQAESVPVFSLIAQPLRGWRSASQRTGSGLQPLAYASRAEPCKVQRRVDPSPEGAGRTEEGGAVLL